MRILQYLLQFTIVRAVLNNETHIDLSPAKIDNEFSQFERNLITEALDYQQDESPETIEAITQLTESFPDLASKYFVFNGINRTVFHASLAYNRPALAMELMKSSTAHRFSLRPALPPGPNALGYLFSPEYGKNIGEENTTGLVSFALENTDINQDGNQILKYAIEIGTFPQVIVSIANHTSGFGYHLNLTMPVLSLVLIAKISEFWWFKATIKALIQAGADINEQFPYLMGPNITFLNLICRQNIPGDIHKNLPLQGQIRNQIRYLLELGADPSIVDGTGMTVCQTSRAFLNTFFLELLNCEDPTWTEQLSYFSRQAWQCVNPHIRFIGLFITILLGIWTFNSLTGNNKKNEFQKNLIAKIIGKYLKWYYRDPQILKKIQALRENKYPRENTLKDKSKIKLKSPKPLPKIDRENKLEVVPKSPAEIKIPEEKNLALEFWNVCKHGNLEIIRQLSVETKDYNFINNGCSPLMITIKNRHFEVTKFLLSLPNIDCDYIDSENQTAMIMACGQKSESLVGLLLNHTPLPRLNKNAVKEGHTLTQTAAGQSQQDELIASTLEALFNMKDDQLALSFLSRFIEAGQISLILYWGDKDDYLINHLIYHGLFKSFKFVLNKMNQLSQLGLINFTNSQNRTPLMIACQSKQEIHTIFAQYILDHAENLRTHQKDRDDESALIKAIRNQKINLANNLMLKGCPLTPAIRNSSEFKKLKTEEQQKLLDTFESLTPPIDEKKSLNHEAKKLPPIKEIRKRKIKKKKDISLVAKIEEKKHSPTLKPKKKVNVKQKYQFDSRYHHEFATLSVNALKNLIAANALQPASPQEIFNQHCQLVIYIFELLKVIAHYDQYLNYHRLDKRDRIIGNELIIRTLKDWQLAMQHNTLPLLVSGQFIKEVKNTADDLKKLAHEDIVDKIIKEHTRKYHFTHDDLKDLYAIMGHHQPVIDGEIKTIIDIAKTPLYRILTDFHLNFHLQIRTQALLYQQMDYIWSYALPILVTKYQSLCYDTSTNFNSHLLQKPKGITNWAAIKDFYSSDWHEIILILMSCGDIHVKKSGHSEYDFKSIDDSLPKKEKISQKRELLLEDFKKRFEEVPQTRPPDIKEFMRDCRHLVRNFLIHDADSLLMISNPDNLIFNSLCQYAKHLWDRHSHFRLEINWMENNYGQYYLHSITEDLCRHSLFRAGSNQGPGDIIIRYLGLG